MPILPGSVNGSMAKLAWLFTVFIMFIATTFASPRSYLEAQKIAETIFNAHRQTLYCGCHYERFNQVDLASCNMQGSGHFKEAHMVEWEHIMPIELIGQEFPCWQEPLCHRDGIAFQGRECCRQISELFRQAEAELYNLWPVIGLVKQARTSYQYGELRSNETFWGCDIQLDNTLSQFEPSDRAKGIVARANLFMAYRYNIKLSNAQHKLFEEWNKQYPPDEWEKKWAASVAIAEGYSNPYIAIPKATAIPR
ncbi:endonuclease [Legionella nagasakiensis]|uniref:endonuclease n=1 Tax=Legionella nagasakiensis TaxID=535290 RepID=UPI001F5F4D1D|nr:endonuclease [Legionella nagasakiensis]